MDCSDEVKDLLESAAAYAGKLYNGIEKSVECLREDNVTEGINLFGEATEGLEWLYDAVKGLDDANDGTAGFDTKAMDGIFKDTVSAFENRDYVLLADLLEYEILPIIDEWGNKLDDILGV